MDEKKPLFPALETEISKKWDIEQTFEKTLAKDSPKGEYVFYDGPPFATGLPHYGHILASTIKDAIPRYWTMKGYHVRRVWGWDCHGLPIENIVEGRLGISGKKQIEEKGVDVFNNTCRDQVLTYAKEWGKMVRRIGRWVDFEHSYKTMDSTYMESVWWAVKQIWEKGLLYEGRKVLLYCPRCETPISNFEVAMDNSYKDVTEESVYVKFKVKDPVSYGLPENTYFVAWTTTPWTLPGNVALAVGKDIEYVLVEQDGMHLIVAKNRLSFVIPSGAEGSSMKGADLVGLSYEPLFEVPGIAESEKAYKVYPASFVTTEDGTGIVHTAVVYGEDDYQLGLEHGLPVVPLLDAQGTFNEEAPEMLRGAYFKDADRLVKKDLDSRGLLLKREQTTHSYPHCWRCSTPLFYNAIPAWFINIQKIKARLIELNEKINWYPDHLKHGRFLNGLENAPDWNISRNRYWATPIPIWKCEACDKIECVGSVEELHSRAVNWSEVYGKTEDVSELDLHKHKLDGVLLSCKCGKTLRRIPEVIDCWVESASMPFAELHAPFEDEELFKKRYPAQFVAEYIAQTRAWFYVMHVMGTLLFDAPPFEHVVTTGTILNEKGEKLSKSKKNYTDPEIILEKYGADALRFYMMSSVVMKADNLFFSDREVDEVVKKVLNLAWNCTQFYVQYKESGLSPSSILHPPSSSHVLDRWMQARLALFIEEVTKEMDAYDTVRACRLIREFIDDLSTWYVRRSRERFKAGGSDAQAAMTMLRHALLELSKVMAPFTPFIAERIYQDVGGPLESVHLEEWPGTQKGIEGVEVIEEMQIVRQIVSLALERRAAAKMPVRQPLARVVVKMKQKLSEELLNIVAEEVNVKAVEVVEGAEGIEVELDTMLTDELKAEGMARELVRRVNDLRKTKGFKIGEPARLTIGTKSDILRRSIELHESDITSGATLSELVVADGVEGEAVEVSGESLTIDIR